MRLKRVHLWWIIPLIILSSLTGAGWWFLDSLRYGTASPLHRAVMQNDIDRVTRLITRHEDVNARMQAMSPETWGATPLHLAARLNRADIVDELIRAGADKDAVNDRGFTPLDAALENGADSAAQSLIRAGAQLDASTRNGSGYALDNRAQPIGIALSRSTIATVQAMLDAGADPKALLGEHVLSWVDAPDMLPKLKLLQERGISLDGPSTAGRPLLAAATNNDVETIRFLLSHGVDIEFHGGEYDVPPLLRAASVGANEAITLLLDRGANPKAGTRDFGSAVYAAAFSGKRDTVRLLLSMNLGIDLQAGRASDAATPLHFAYWNRDPEMADLLIKAGALPDARTRDGRLPSAFRK